MPAWEYDLILTLGPLDPIPPLFYPLRKKQREIIRLKGIEGDRRHKSNTIHRYNLREDIREWCRDNLLGSYQIVRVIAQRDDEPELRLRADGGWATPSTGILFESERDFTLFKLFWHN